MAAHRDEIEFEEPETSVSECCDATTTRLSRFIYRDDQELCSYNAMFSTGQFSST